MGQAYPEDAILSQPVRVHLSAWDKLPLYLSTCPMCPRCPNYFSGGCVFMQDFISTWARSSDQIPDSCKSEYFPVVVSDSESIAQRPSRTNLDLASAFNILNRAGVRLMLIEGLLFIGIWRELDSAEIRDALSEVGGSELPVRYLDDPDVPEFYKLRKALAQPVLAGADKG